MKLRIEGCNPRLWKKSMIEYDSPELPLTPVTTMSFDYWKAQPWPQERQT